MLHSPINVENGPSKFVQTVDKCYKYENIGKRLGSGGGRVVKLLACGARGQGFDSPPCHLNFRDWLSPASKSRYG